MSILYHVDGINRSFLLSNQAKINNEMDLESWKDEGTQGAQLLIFYFKPVMIPWCNKRNTTLSK